MNQETKDPYMIEIFCNNVHESNPITATILHKHSNPKFRAPIIVITEPWVGTVRAETQEKGTVRHPDWKCITPTSIRDMRVAVYYRKDAPYRVTPLTHEQCSSTGILPVKITMGESFSITLIAVYNSPSSFEASDHLQTTNLPTGPTILCGDFNLHSPDWDDTVEAADWRASAFQDWLTLNSLWVLNDPSKPTYHGHRFQHAKVDDLAMANSDVFTSYDIGPVQVHNKRHFGSDHYPISFKVYTNDFPLPPAQHFTLSEERREDWVAYVTPIFDDLLRNSPQNANPESLDLLAAAIISTIQDATQRTMHMSQGGSHHAKHWWNGDLDHVLTQLREQAKGIKETNGNPIIVKQYEGMKKAFRARVRHAKQTWATNRLEGATSHTVWEFIKWYKHGGKRCRPLYSTPSHVPASSDQERARTFAEQFFPVPPPVQPFNPTDDPAPERTANPLIMEEIEHAIKSCQKNTAPGPSQINYTAVKWIWEANPDLLFYLYSHCLQTGHYPTPFKHSITTVVPKPNKNNYENPAAYRPIQLLECLGKVLDKVIARRIQYEVAAHEVVPLTQFGGRIHSSTIDAGLAFVQDIHDAWNRKQKASALFFDITGFFNFVNHDGLVARLTHHGFDKSLTKLIHSFLKDRTTTFSFDGFLSDPFQIQNGIPQGSPLSPILAIIYGSELQKLQSLIKRRILSFAYIDDGALLTFSSTLDINVKKLQEAFRAVSGWLTENGLEIQPEKLELMHFTKGRDPSSPVFHLPGQRPIAAPKTIRWLGFYLDRHLYFTHHSKMMAARATATGRAMGILGNTVRGMSHVQLRQLTISTIIPTLTYGCQLWWGGRYSKSNTARLQTSLNGVMRLICRAFKTTPVLALQYISHIPPITHIIHKTCYSASIRLHRLLPTSPVLQRIPTPRQKIRLVHSLSNTSAKLRISSQKLSPLERIAELSNATSTPTLNPIQEAPWERSFSDDPRVTTILPPSKGQREEYKTSLEELIVSLRAREDVLIISTDGSRRRKQGTKRTGAGIVVRHENRVISKHSFGVGRRTNVYDGESLALMAGMKLAGQYCLEHPNITQLFFFSDSSSALTNITHTNPHPSQSISLLFIKYAKEFLHSQNHHIGLQWVPGHQGFEDNEQADRLAYRGCRSSWEFYNSSTLSYHAEKRSRLVQSQWRHEWQEWRRKQQTSAFGTITYRLPTIKPSKVFMDLEDQQEVFGRLTQVRTMHGHNPHFLHRFNIHQFDPNESNCICGHTIPPYPARHFRDHILHNCEAYAEHRHILSKVSRDHDPSFLLNTTRGLLATTKFLKRSGAFTATGTPYNPPPVPSLPYHFGLEDPP
jgi:ribonuclease HI